MNYNHVGNIVLFFVGAIGISYCVYILSGLCAKNKYLSRFLIFEGRNTILINGFNYIVMFTWDAVWRKVTKMEPNWIIRAIGTIIGITIFAYIENKIKKLWIKN